MTRNAAAESAVLPSILILAFMASLGPFGDTEYTPSLPRIAAALGITYGQAQWTMTVYLAGFALSQILYGPFSDGALYFLVGNFIEPKRLGKSVQLHPLTMLLALMFWGVLWGPLGILLATPITGILALLLSNLSLTRPLARVLAGQDESHDTPSV